VPELSAPVSVPFATTPLAVARKLVMVAVSESLDEVPPASSGPGFAVAGGARTAAKATVEKAAATSLRIVSLLVDEIDPPPAPRVLPEQSVLNR
jgi:hypothetical protein